MRKILIFLFLLVTSFAAHGQTLTSITILPPAAGYNLTSNTATAQLSTLCGWSAGPTTNCSTVTLNWGSGQPAAMTVSSTGLVTGAGGPTNVAPDIYVYNGTGASTVVGHHPVRVASYTITTLSFSHTESATLSVGGTGLIGVSDQSGATIGSLCSFSSSNTAVATVNNVGEVTGVSVGTAVITVGFGGVTNTRTITVVNPTLSSRTWYVRSAGGTVWTSRVTSGQCNGSANVDYPGTGTNVNCAVNNPEYCFTDESSSSAYTGIVQSTDTCYITPAATPYHVVMKDLTHQWVTNNTGTMAPPRGLPGHPTRVVGSNYLTPETDQEHVGNRSAMVTMGPQYQPAFSFGGSQFIDTENIDVSTGNDCNQNITGGNIDFPCPLGKTPFIVSVDNFTSDWTDYYSRYHGAFNAVTGTPGPRMVHTGTSVEYNYLDGYNFDDPFGSPGVVADGFTADRVNIAMNGCTEEQPKTLASVARDGAGNLNVTFASGQVVNYIANNKFVLTGATPTALNGTYPVSAIVFNQQTVTITGGSVVTSAGAGNSSPNTATFTTSTAPAFTVGSFVNIVGASPSFLNGGYEVFAVSGTGFTVIASSDTRPGWTPVTISSGGTAATAISLTASASGASSTATVVGTGGHVLQQHRCTAQGDGGAANGDAVGTGAFTIGAYNLTNSHLYDNTQDGWDMLHSAITTTNVTGNRSEGNMGAPFKFGNMDVGTLSNNLFLGNAGKMLAFDPNKPPDYNQYLTTFYRAGDVLPIHVRMFSRAVVTNNTFLTGFPVVMDDFCDDAVGCVSLASTLGAYYYFQNNAMYGYSDTYLGFVQPGLYCGAGCNGSTPANAAWAFLNNIAFNMKTSAGSLFPGAGASNQLNSDPGLIAPIANVTSFAGESALQTYNAGLLSSALARGFGVANAYTPTTDYAGVATTSPPVTGALNYQSGTPTVATATASPTPGTFPSTVTATFTSSTSGAVLCYTTDGSTPTATTPGTCSTGTTLANGGSVTFSTSTSFNVIATAAAYTNSSLATFAYTVTPSGVTLTIYQSGNVVSSGNALSR